ncbi:hypothetical protein TB1_004358 [Malus domestica]
MPNLLPTPPLLIDEPGRMPSLPPTMACEPASSPLGMWPPGSASPKTPTVDVSAASPRVEPNIAWLSAIEPLKKETVVWIWVSFLGLGSR